MTPDQLTSEQNLDLALIGDSSVAAFVDRDARLGIINTATRPSSSWEGAWAAAS